mmetsp:Transcript_91999/g.168714  ORF Transcript_91999/g.168714 Transcript_91999/m.168714 type:complete len:225 (-) Transcript_91999:26-700(-)
MCWLASVHRLDQWLQLLHHRRCPHGFAETWVAVPDAHLTHQRARPFFAHCGAESFLAGQRQCPRGQCDLCDWAATHFAEPASAQTIAADQASVACEPSPFRDPRGRHPCGALRSCTPGRLVGTDGQTGRAETEATLRRKRFRSRLEALGQDRRRGPGCPANDCTEWPTLHEQGVAGDCDADILARCFCPDLVARALETNGKSAALSSWLLCRSARSLWPVVDRA